MDDYQDPLTGDPRDCLHGVDAWTLCDTCLTEMLDGNGMLGRFSLVGVGAGLAVDFRQDGRVVVYMLNADTAVFGEGGVADAWVTHDDHYTNAPHVVLAEPTVHPVPIGSEEVARFCEILSDLATALLPVIREGLDSEVDPEVWCDGFYRWVDGLGLKLRTQILVSRVASMLTRAIMQRELETLP